MTEQKDFSRRHGYWIHTRVEDNNSVTGFFTLPECKCSNCGFQVSFERERCPHCMSIMDGEHK